MQITINEMNEYTQQLETRILELEGNQHKLQQLMSDMNNELIFLRNNIDICVAYVNAIPVLIPIILNTLNVDFIINETTSSCNDTKIHHLNACTYDDGSKTLTILLGSIKCNNTDLIPNFFKLKPKQIIFSDNAKLKYSEEYINQFIKKFE